MKTITNDNYKLLLEYSLEYKDVIKFSYKGKIYSYQVYDSYLRNIDNDSEDKIFRILSKDGLINQTFSDFLSDCYGYPCFYRIEDSSMWRDYRKEDWLAATNTVLRIFNIIEDNEKPVTSIPLKQLTNISFLK